MLEKTFQRAVISELKQRFDGCVVLKNDANYIQGVPDLIVLYQNRWAMLEIKRSEREERQPNQTYYVNKLNSMSFARFIYPENKEEVFNDLQQAFES